MKVVSRSFLSLIVTLLASTTVEAIRGDTKQEEQERQEHHGCYHNWTEMQLAFQEPRQDPTQTKQIVVCPNTVLGAKGGYSEIAPPPPNVEFLCGEDGSSNNHCIIQGRFWTRKDDPYDLTMRGFTFQGQERCELIIMRGGMSLQDCVFEDSTLLVYFIDSLSPNDGSTRKLSITDSIFRNIKMHQNAENPRDVLTIGGNETRATIENCVFQNNQVDGFGIVAMNGAKIDLQNNCFIDNQYLSTDDLEDEKCAFRYRDGTNIECIPNQIEACDIEWFHANTVIDEKATAEERDLENNH